MKRTGKRLRTRGFTLLEVLVAMSVFIAMGTVLVMMLDFGVRNWRTGERRRRAYERAQEVLTQVSLDLEAVHSRDPVPAGVPTARLFCTQGVEGQKLSFVRSYGSGPERGGTEPSGIIGVTYYRQGRTLFRTRPAAPRAARAGDLASLIDVSTGAPEVLATNVLFVGYRFWTQYTTGWTGPPPDPRKGTGGGPETVWDSTRGAGIGAVDEKTGRTRPFFMFRGAESLAEPSDDVFPEIVEVTLVVESDERRATKTELVEPMSESDPVARVTTTKGFEDPADGSPYLLIGNEWVKVKSKELRTFTLAERGARLTPRVSHDVGTVVRAGTTIVLRVYVPAHREDWSNQIDFLQKVRQP